MAFFHSLDKAAVEPLSFIYRLIMSDPGPAASRKGVGVEGEEWVSGWESGALLESGKFKGQPGVTTPHLSLLSLSTAVTQRVGL